MSINPITALQFQTHTHTLEAADTATETNFATWLNGQLQETNAQLNAADQALSDLALDQTNNLHQAMLTFEEAKLSFQYLEQLRNRLLSAYQELLRESI